MKNVKNLSQLYDYLNELSYYFDVKYEIIVMIENAALFVYIFVGVYILKRV